jgi:hypothetical protein
MAKDHYQRHKYMLDMLQLKKQPDKARLLA